MARRIAVLLMVFAVGVGWLAAGACADESEPPQEDDYELYKLLVDTLDQVERNYVKEVSRRELIEAAIRGVLRELDPYSAYIEPKHLDRFRTSVDGSFGGVGMQVAKENGWLRVLSPLLGTPAYRAGIIAGDQITEINGNSTKGISLQEAVDQLTGEPGTEVTLTVLHSGKSEPEKITITREIIHVETVLGDHRKEDDRWDFMLDRQKQMGYIRVAAFTRDTARELREALSELTKENLRGLILDLRFNPGGLLTSAIDVSDLFLSTGTIVSANGRSAPERSWEAKEEGTFEGFPVVVLVNRYSASASEIVAACLQDHKRAVVMGERTWGKGSVQNVIPLEENRSALKLTTASYLRPSGKNIHRFPDAGEEDEWGVFPDDGYELKLTDEEMLALLRDRRERDVLRPKQPEPAETDLSSQPKPEEGAAAPPSPPGEGAESVPPPGEGTERPSQPDESGVSKPDESGVSKPEESGESQPSEPHADAPGKQEEPQAADQPPPEPEASTFVDPQLKMAIDYLSAELARAD